VAKREVIQGTKLGLENAKIVKWIIEVAALNDKNNTNSYINKNCHF
jgi:deoxyribose-phosphate aldolase